MASCRAERCPDATGKDRRHCQDTCRALTGCAAGAARTRTFAAIVTECRAAGGVWTSRQRLEIRRGDCPPITVMTVEGNEPVPDIGLCQIYGEARSGAAGLAIGALQGLALSLDGNTVLFQVTDEFVGHLAIGGVPIASPRPAITTKGIFVVQADGSRLKRISDPSREMPFAVVPTDQFPFVSVNIKYSNGFSFSPDGRSVVFTDRGLGADGSDAPQVFTIDPRRGTRRQLTSFTSASSAPGPLGLPLDALFLDNRRIGGEIYDPTVGARFFQVQRDGRDFRYIDAKAPLALPGATLVPTFRVSRLLSDIFVLTLPTTTDLPRPGFVEEIFARSGGNLLQLTNFGRSDTLYPVRLRDREHVAFVASGDPVDRNPSNTCQLFSVDVLARRLRQLTHFDGALPSTGCFSDVDGCTVGQAVDIQDPVTGAIVFDSSCKAFGSNATSQQIFAIQPDGSGFRQATNYRGLVTGDDGSVSVELPGPIAYQSLLE